MRLLILIAALLASGFARAQSYYLFVGTYTNTGNLAGNPNLDSTGSKGIYVYRFDGATGKAIGQSHTEGVCNPSYLAISADGDRLYACTESRMKHKGSVSAFVFDRQKGELHLINKRSSFGDNPAYVAVDHNSKWLLVANYTAGSYTTYPLEKDGAIGKQLLMLQFAGHGVNPGRQEAPHVHSTVFSPDEKYFYIQDLGLDRISIEHAPGKDTRKFAPVMMTDLAWLPANERAGQPQPVPNYQDPAKISTVPGSGPRHLTFHPNGKFAYLIEEMGGCVDVYGYQPTTGHLDSLQRIAAHPDTAKGPFRSSDIHVSPDGRFLYASNRAETTIAIFAVDTATGLLRALGYVPTMGIEPRNFTLDPSGKWLLVANQESDSIAIFRVDTSTGMIQPTGETLKVPKPTCLKME